MNKNPVYIIMPAKNLNSIYSIATIVQEQLKYFKDNAILLGNVGIEAQVKNIQVFDLIKSRHAYIDWEENMDLYKDDLDYYNIQIEKLITQKKNLTIITHDLVLFPAFLPLIEVLLNLSRKNDIKILNWVHSTPDRNFKHKKPDLFIDLPKKFIFIFPDNLNRDSVSEHFNVPLEKIVTIPNYSTFMAENELEKYMEMAYASKYDYIITFPSRIVYQKGIDTLIRLAQYLVRNGDFPLFFFIPSYGASRQDYALLSYYRLLIKQYDIEENFVIVTEPGNTTGITKNKVFEFYRVSDFFISASQTETFSLAALEAARSKCICILNENVLSYRTMCGDEAYYIDFTLPDLHIFQAIHKIISAEVTENKILRLKKRIYNYFCHEQINSELQRIINQLDE